MAWSGEFLANLTGRTQAPSYRVESFAPAGDQAGRNPDTGLRLSSYRREGYEPIIQSVAVSGSRLTMRSWSTSNGALDVVLVSDLSTVRDRIRRGLWVTLIVDWPDGSNGVVFVGAVSSLTRTGDGLWRLRCLDLLASLRCRPSRTTDEYRLFHDLGDSGISTNLTAGYTASDATLTVASTTGFEKDSGRNGLVKVTPTTGDPFYLRYSGSTATSFTVGGTVSGELGTTAVNAQIGDTVESVAGTPSRHPHAVVRAMLTSTGTASANGALDVWPASWSCAVPEWVFDASDCVRWQELATGSTQYQSTFLYTTAQDSPKSVLDTFLASQGFIATVRQGLITVRPIVSAIDQYPAPYSYSIDDRDIEEIVAYEQWSDDSDPVYYKLAVSTCTANDDATVATSTATQGTRQLPASDTYTIDLSDPNGGIHSEQSANRTQTLTRLKRYFWYPFETVRLRAPDRRFGRMAIGDVVSFSTNHLTGWHSGDRTGITERPALVTAVSVGWERGSSTVDLVIPRKSQIVGA